MSPKPKKATDAINSPNPRKNARAYHTVNKSEKPHLMDSVQRSVHKKKMSFNGALSNQGNDPVMGNMDGEATDCTYNTMGNGTIGY